MQALIEFLKAKSNDGLVESFCHNSSDVMGIMWHPERNQQFTAEDQKFFETLFKEK